ncbi:low temperature requirement A [Purpureocillium lilacinum]|uniref:Low temperature requirement A n=1 Tax=Purpureocillium lilacinum TaxID=33203 RepID=A0A179GQ92_PURLI|nr:low temperature requirement A [Purpureocillium lilacinum]OAQ79461.1 low temperature requirement A [Purpureocillium lilacinum]
MHESDHETGSAPTRLKLVGSPLVSNKGARKPESAASSELGHSHQRLDQADSTLLEELPIFQRHNESTAIELFYDLFFVANLATFSNIHEIQSVSTLTSYIGFFCVLWFTWCLTSMHDIRFVSDSLSSRIAKGAHLGVMVGLAVAGPKYASEGHPAELRVLALILMVSRIVLALQYLLVLFHVRTYKNSKLPLGLIAGFSLAAAFIYLGVSFASTETDHAYRALYVVAVAEMVVNIGVASQWRVVSFKGTHLIERMSLLTLYILGEGVIDVLKSVTKISQAQDYWTAGNIGTLLGAILTIYLFYMLYFDTLNRHHFGSIRQQIWSFLHFPFHAALVLCVSGMAQFVTWQKIAEVLQNFSSEMNNRVEDVIDRITSNDSAEAVTDRFISEVQLAINHTFTAYPPEDAFETNETIKELVETLKEKLLDSISSATPNLDDVEHAIVEITSKVFTSIMSKYGLEAPEESAEGAEDFYGDLNARIHAAILFFEYFFIAAGFSLIILGILGLVNVRKYTLGSWLRFATHFLFGTGLCLVCLLATRPDNDWASALAGTAWPLPMVALVLLIVISVHHLSRRREKSVESQKYQFLPRWRKTEAPAV